MHKDLHKTRSNVEKRLVKLGEITDDVIDLLTKQKVEGETINAADTYFILSQALQKVSLSNIIELEGFKQNRKQSQYKMVI